MDNYTCINMIFPWNTTKASHIHKQMPFKASTRNTLDMRPHHYWSSPGDLWKLLDYEVCSPRRRFQQSTCKI